jgi:hypothetical protein
MDFSGAQNGDDIHKRCTQNFGWKTTFLPPPKAFIVIQMLVFDAFGIWGLRDPKLGLLEVLHTYTYKMETRNFVWCLLLKKVI